MPPMSLHRTSSLLTEAVDIDGSFTPPHAPSDDEVVTQLEAYKADGAKQLATVER